MEKTWKPTTAGVLSIISGAIDIILGTVTVVASHLVIRFVALAGMEWVTELVIAVVMIIGPVLIVLGAVAVVGGIYALKRRVWGLALAGSLCALSGATILGILAIIFVALGKGEFE